MYLYLLIFTAAPATAAAVLFVDIGWGFTQAITTTMTVIFRPFSSTGAVEKKSAHTKLERCLQIVAHTMRIPRAYHFKDGFFFAHTIRIPLGVFSKVRGSAICASDNIWRPAKKRAIFPNRSLLLRVLMAFKEGKDTNGHRACGGKRCQRLRRPGGCFKRIQKIVIYRKP